MTFLPQGLTIRVATPSDLSQIAGIYAHHVRHGTASFEAEAPSLQEMTRRHAVLMEGGMPWLVLEQEGMVLGYSYAGPYRPRPAYRDTVENSVYIRAGFEGRGHGRALLGALIDACTALGLRQMVAVVGDSGNTPSIALHRSMGFRDVGVLHAVGFKHGRWLDCVLLQRSLGPGSSAPPVPRG
ncbi:GNAT family N-acetyltransferase [Pseudoroseomonas globiformis]|uniref:GNAT family N-acetyltransferase n=1 Tax=Teichococcus globiformis TaxID=2307229 RepID=A0ABV7FZH7_9PROT